MSDSFTFAGAVHRYDGKTFNAPRLPASCACREPYAATIRACGRAPEEAARATRVPRPSAARADRECRCSRRRGRADAFLTLHDAPNASSCTKTSLGRKRTLLCPQRPGSTPARRSSRDHRPKRGRAALRVRKFDVPRTSFSTRCPARPERREGAPNEVGHDLTGAG